ncbi:FUSC family protein [Acuticoccus sp. M5D2P5]|uniref:FUSC family protein n=1 Tax=Acuticoccus kalidii TaxID=2910977 RepID=UPI001F1DA7E1|nr:FUSC family protein [Acuticoccus kalidii]MCF3932116.1 FUSC family protein [Acuticoccus kalidii]
MTVTDTPNSGAMGERRHAAPRTAPGAWLAATSARLAASPAIYASKVALVVVLSLYAAFLLDLDHTYWALITIPFIVQPDGGTTVWRATGRLLGTLLGCFSGFLIAVLFGQTGEVAVLAAAVFVFIAAVFGRMQRGLDAYGYGSGALVTLIIILDTGPNVDNAFTLALARTTETAIPVVIAFIVMLVVFPRSISDQAAARLRETREATLKLVHAILCYDPDAVGVAYEPTVLPSLSAANIALRGLAYERTRRNHLRPRMTAVALALHKLAIRAETGRFALTHVPDEARDTDISAARRRFAAAVERLPAADSSAEQRLAAANDMAALAETLHPRQVLPPEGGDLSDRGLRVGAAFFRMRIMALAVEELMRAEAALVDPSRPAEPIAPFAGRYFDRLGALEYALRPTIVLLVLSAIWFATAWPNGLVLALIATAVTLIFPMLAPREARIAGGKALGIGIWCGGAIAMVLMILLPNVEGFGALALILGGAIFAIFYTAQGPQNIPYAIGSVIAISVGFQPQNTPVFEPVGLVNTAITLTLLPVVLIIALTVIFPEDAAWIRRHLRRATDRLLTEATTKRNTTDGGAGTLIAQFVDILVDLGLSIAPSDTPGIHLRTRARAAMIVSGELHHQRRIEAAGHLPADLAAFGPRLCTAVLVSAQVRRGPADLTVFAELRETLRRLYRRTDLDEEARLESLRYAAVSELLAAILATGQLSRRPEGAHAS